MKLKSRKLTLAEQAVAEARRVQQGHLTGGEIMVSHMVIQGHFGWTVRSCHPNEPDVPHVPNGRVEKLDAFVQTDRGTRRMRLRVLNERLHDDTKRAEIRKLSVMRDLARARVHAGSPDEE